MDKKIFQYLGLDKLSEADAHLIDAKLQDYFNDVIVTTFLSSLTSSELEKLREDLQADKNDAFEKMVSELSSKNPELTKIIGRTIALDLTTLKEALKRADIQA